MDVGDAPSNHEPVVAVTREQFGEWMEADRIAFEEGDRSAALRALGCAKLTGYDPPRWAWEFIVVGVGEWSLAEKNVTLASVLGLNRVGHAASRRIHQHDGTMFWLARQLKEKHKRQRVVPIEEEFWRQVVDLAVSDWDAVPVAWDTAKRMAKTYETTFYGTK